MRAIPAKRLSRGLLCILLLCAPLLTWGQSSNPRAQSLLANYQQQQQALAQNAFGAPIVLTADVSKQQAQGEVYALLNTPFAQLGKILKQSSDWCELAILHVNIKACTYDAEHVRLYVGRKHYQAPAEAFPVQYRFQQLADDADFLSLQLDAPNGPFGTSDYLISLEAIPLDAQHSFIRFDYRYRFGLMARMALNTYLATLGSDKVGFTVTDTDAQGGPVYVKGLQGVVERNVMRYLMAIQSVLETSELPVERRTQAQFTSWYDSTRKYPRQLLELERSEYLSNKQRELTNQQALQLPVRVTALN